LTEPYHKIITFAAIGLKILRSSISSSGKKVMRISRQPSPVTIMIDQKQLESVECFKYFGNILKDVRVKLNPGLAW